MPLETVYSRMIRYRVQSPDGQAFSAALIFLRAQTPLQWLTERLDIIRSRQATNHKPASKGLVVTVLLLWILLNSASDNHRDSKFLESRTNAQLRRRLSCQAKGIGNFRR